MSKTYLSLGKSFTFTSICWAPEFFTRKWSEGEVDKRRDKGSLTEAKGINQVRADKEKETGRRRKDRKMSLSNGSVCGLAANLDCAMVAASFFPLGRNT